MAVLGGHKLLIIGAILLVRGTWLVSSQSLWHPLTDTQYVAETPETDPKYCPPGMGRNGFLNPLTPRCILVPCSAKVC